MIRTLFIYSCWRDKRLDAGNEFNDIFINGFPLVNDTTDATLRDFRSSSLRRWYAGVTTACKTKVRGIHRFFSLSCCSLLRFFFFHFVLRAAMHTLIMVRQNDVTLTSHLLYLLLLLYIIFFLSMVFRILGCLAFLLQTLINFFFFKILFIYLLNIMRRL